MVINISIDNSDVFDRLMYREKSNYYFGIKPSEGVEVNLQTELISEKGEFIKPQNEQVLAAILPYIIEGATIQFVFTPISSCNECYAVTFVVIKKDQLSYLNQKECSDNGVRTTELCQCNDGFTIVSCKILSNCS